MKEIFEFYFEGRKNQYIQKRYCINDTVFYQNYLYRNCNNFHYNISILDNGYLSPTHMKRKEYEENFNRG